MAGLPVSESELRSILVTDLEIISDDDFHQARVMARRLRIPIERAIVERARVPYRFLLEQLAAAWGVEFIDLKVSDGVWALFDPTSQLPRDPATLVVDLSGTARMAINIFDPKEAETIAGAPPGELESLDVREVKVSAVGAELTGKGAMTFDNSGPAPKPPSPTT